MEGKRRERNFEKRATNKIKTQRERAVNPLKQMRHLVVRSTHSNFSVAGHSRSFRRAKKLSQVLELHSGLERSGAGSDGYPTDRFSSGASCRSLREMKRSSLY